MRPASNRFLFTLALCCIALSQSAALSQQKPQPTPPQSAQGQDDREVVTIREVRLPVTVIGKDKQPVAGLTRNDFLIYEDKQLQAIRGFTDEKDSQPIYVAVLMDTSGSVAGKLKFEQESAKNFIYTVIRLRKDRVAFATFDHEIKLRQDFTDKLNLLDDAVDSVKKPGNRTLFYDAVWQFCDEKMRSVPGRRVLVVITDGDDNNYSRATLNDAIDIAQRTETTIFAVSTKAGLLGTVPGVEGGTTSSGADRDLQKLCEETGGTAFFTGDILELERAFTRISKELRSTYIITYKPTNDKYDGSKRKIEVKLASNRDGLKVKTRKEYKAISDSLRK
ncbi:MAG: Ca-activated chloride channel [Acidobacteriota bacterium]|jgi:VWFA-related protein|nr:Ca-activated chloride channel [Acidobacteriota bacterium]